MPYKGNGPGLNDLIGGQVQGMFDSKAALAFVKAGKLKALGIDSLKPSTLAPDLKPIAQSGVPEPANFATASWFGVLALEGTPKLIQSRLHADIRAVLDTPDRARPSTARRCRAAAHDPGRIRRLPEVGSGTLGQVIRDKNIKAD